jgi:hypothetical protein
MRANTLSVLSQLSKFGHDSADPISMQTVRQTLKLDAVQNNPGIEGASNLYYYLFDDWRAVYHTVAMYHQRLEDLVRTPRFFWTTLANKWQQTTIFNDMVRLVIYITLGNTNLSRLGNPIKVQTSKLSPDFTYSAEKFVRSSISTKVTRT